MEGKVIKEEIIGSPPSSSPPPPLPPISNNSNNTPLNTTTGHIPSGKENRSHAHHATSPPLTPSEIQTRSRSKGLIKEHYPHHHHHHHHRMSESPKMVGLGSHPPQGTSNSSSTSTSQQSPTIVANNNSKSSHGKAFGHSFSSPHSTTALTNGINSASTGVNTRVTSPSPSPTGSANGGRTSSTSNNTPNTGSSKTEHLSLSGTSRLIVKIKRFLGTLLHFGCDISPEVGDRVRSLVFNLVSGHLTIEDFHHTLQEVTSFPLRPFVVPFLKAHLPLLQREISHLARISKQSPLSFVRTHEQVIVESGSSPGEPCDIFHSEAGESLGLLPGKRKSESLYENGDGTSDGIPNYSSTPKRFNGGRLFSPPFFLSNLSSALHPASSSSGSSDLRDFYSNAAGYHLLTSQLHSLQSDSSSHSAQSQSTPASGPLPTTNGMTPGMTSSGKGAPEDEWRNIHVMLNCILSMVEKTKRALTILQTRNTSHDATEHNLSGTPSSGSSAPSNSWLRRPLSGFPTLESTEEFKRHAGEMMAQALRATEDRVAEVKRRAEDAVLEVKRQALAELQRAVAAAEARACDAVQAERARLERVFLDSRRNGGESLVPVDPETCWNCGRKAHETCSGCNTARYCSSFCQHKDWEQHHNNCGRGNSERERERDGRHHEAKNAHVNVHVQQPENSNSPINVSHPSPDNRSSGSRSN